MPGFTLSTTTRAPVEEVWKLLFDPARFPEWWSGIAAVHVGTAGELTMFHEEHLDFPMPQELRADRASGRVTMSCQVTDIDFSWELAESGAGTTITAQVEFPPSQAFRVDGQRRAIGASLRALAALAEAR
jgi:uncharacterized protein YndB with AHSA1/START domain